MSRCSIGISGLEKVNPPAPVTTYATIGTVPHKPKDIPKLIKSNLDTAMVPLMRGDGQELLIISIQRHSLPK